MNESQGSVSSLDGFAARRPLSQSFAQTAVDYFNLTKPRILVLLLISTCCPMILAAGGQVHLELLFAALLGGALISGSASVINCIWDCDIDSVMKRTSARPLPAGRVSLAGASIFASVLCLLGFWVLWTGLGPLAAIVAAFGHWFYVVVYTLWLKRTTPQNIVIGGAAGAIPPIVGWVGITGRIDLEAILLFLMVFLWTPPHFWALALVKNQDYQRARVPMLPVVRGEMVTVNQMLWYALSLLPVSIALVLVNSDLGFFSYVTLSALGLIFIWKILCLRYALRVDSQQHEKLSWEVFGFSLVYLGLYFACLVVDSMLL